MSYETNEHHTITSPGKFEGEKRYVPYFWELSLDGGCESDEPGIFEVQIMDEDIQKFPELAGYNHVRLFECDSGFVYGELME